MSLVSILSKLSTDSQNPPISAINELIQWISKGKLSENELGSCWHLTSQLIDKYPKYSSILRPLVLEFMVVCMTHHSIRMGPIIWKEFLKFASTDWEGNADLESRITVLIQLTKDGRDVTGIEDEIGAVLVSWLKEILVNGNQQNSVLLLAFITNIFKFSRLYLSTDQVFQLLELNKQILCLKTDELVITSALQLYDAVTRYGGMPESCLELITDGLIKLDSQFELTEAILRNILASHLSTRLVRILIDYLDGDAEKEFKTIHKSIALLTSWKWKDNVVSLNLSHYLLLSLCLKFAELENYILLIMDSLSIFLNSNSPSIIEWSLAVKIGNTIIPRLVMNGKIIQTSNKNNMEENKSIENVVDTTISQIISNFSGLLPQDKKEFLGLLHGLLPHLDDQGCLFLIEQENDLYICSRMVPALLKRSDGGLLPKIVDKIERSPSADNSIISILVDVLHIVENESVFLRLLEICLRFPDSKLLDQLSHILETSKNEDRSMSAAKGISRIWSRYCDSNNPENMESAINVFRRILSHFTEEKLPKASRIYFGKFLSEFRLFHKRIQYYDMDTGHRKICHYLADEESLDDRQISVFPINEYFSQLTKFLNREPNWNVYNAVLPYLKNQLADAIIFESSAGRRFIADFTQALISMIQTDTVGAQLIDVPPNSKASDFYAVFLHLLSSILESNKRLFIKKQLDDCVLCFIAGLSRPNISRLCMHSLTISIYEYPFSIMKYLSSIILKLSQMTSLSQGIQNLEFLAHLGKAQSLHVNLTEDDYKRVFGISLQYLRVEAKEDAQSRYIVHLAHKVLSLWFVSLQISERRIYLPFINRQLMVNGLNNISELVLDTLVIYSYSDCEARSQISPSMVGGKTWLCGNTLVTVNNHPTSVEWNEIIIRRPSGTLLMCSKLENSVASDNQPYIPATLSYLINKIERNDTESQKKTHSRSFSTGSVNRIGLQDRASRARQLSAGSNTNSSLLLHKRRSISASSHSSIFDASVKAESEVSGTHSEPDYHSVSRERRIDPSFIIAQMTGIPNHYITDNSNLPILLSEDESTSRALSVLDRTPVLDLHKIGILFIDKGQESESQILGNYCGSKLYGEFLESLGTWFLLKEAGNLYSGGLDTSSEVLDGPFALTHADKLSQCVFHVTTVMPSNPNDPMSTSKKRHIGNNFVNIIWNESGKEYSMDTLGGQFNFVAIVIQPLKKEFQVKVLTKTEIPNHFLFHEPRIVSQNCLGTSVRTLAIHCDTFSQMMVNRFVSGPKERLEQIYRLRERQSISTTNDISRIHDFSLYL